MTAVDNHETSGQRAEEIERETLPELQPEPGLIAPALAANGRERPYRYGEHYFPHDVKIARMGFAGPLHDINSHGSDAFGEFAVNCPLAAPKPAGSEG